MYAEFCPAYEQKNWFFAVGKIFVYSCNYWYTFKLLVMVAFKFTLCHACYSFTDSAENILVLHEV